MIEDSVKAGGTHIAGHSHNQLALPSPTARAATLDELLGAYQRCAACAPTNRPDADQTVCHPNPQARQLLAALADLFGSRVFPRYATACPHGQGETRNAAGQPPVDLARLPLGLLRRLLDAFALKIHLDPHRRRVRLHITISALTLTLTVHHLTVPGADRLAHAQYAAIMEVLQWLHDHPAR